MGSDASSFTYPVGRATNDNEHLFHAGPDGRDVLSIPEQAKEMQTRLMACAHITDSRHLGVVATLQRLQGYSLFLASHEGLRDRVRLTMSTLHELEGG